MKKTALALLLSAMIFAACARQGEPLTVAELCRQDDGTLVTVEGFLVLPNFMNSLISQKTGIKTYELFLAAQADGKGELIKTSVRGTRGSETNHIAELAPDGYTQKDLRIYTDAGKTAGSLDRLKITGEISKTASSCILKIHKIETP